MKIILESTTRIVTIGGNVRARIWEGTTDSGIHVIAMIPSLAVADHEDQSEFQRELEGHRPPSRAAVEAFPLRMVT